MFCSPMQGVYKTLLMRSLMAKHKEKSQGVAERTRTADAIAEKAERDRDVDVGKIRAALDKRTSKVEGLRI